ncbi:MAG: hypothetical protein ABSB52_02455 [Acidimicrobiales bacterium]|jgi:hypothetical protein
MRRDEHAKNRLLPSPTRAVVTGVIVVALVVCGWFAAGLTPLRAEANAVTFSAAAAILALSAVGGHLSGREQQMRDREPKLAGPRHSLGARDTSWRPGGFIAWSGAALLVVAVELWELFHSPRSAYPTLSSLANEVIGPGHRPARAAAFVCWGALGFLVAARPGRRS